MSHWVSGNSGYLVRILCQICMYLLFWSWLLKENKEEPWCDNLIWKFRKGFNGWSCFVLPSRCFSVLCKVYLYERFHSPAGSHMFKVNDRDSSTRCLICANLTIKTKEDFDNLVPVSLLFTLNILHVLP